MSPPPSFISFQKLSGTLNKLFRRIFRQKKNLMTAFYSHKVLRFILGQSAFMVPFPPLPLPDSQGFDDKLINITKDPVLQIWFFERLYVIHDPKLCAGLIVFFISERLNHLNRKTIMNDFNLVIKRIVVIFTFSPSFFCQSFH